MEHEVKNTMSYPVRISRENRKHIQNTVDYYQSAVNFLVDIAAKEWDYLASFNSTERQGVFDKMVHATSRRKAKYSSFDRRFYKMPSYLRLSAQRTALGIVSSWKSNLQNWIDQGMEGKAPQLGRWHPVMPAFYRGNCFQLDGNTCSLKLRVDNDWKWVSFELNKSDLAYIERHFSIDEASAPVLENRHGKYGLRFTFTSSTPLPEEVHTVCAVDLGINHDAVCSIVHEDGTVTARKFINSAGNKDRMWTIFNQIRKAQSKGSRHTRALWREYDGYSKAVVNDTVKGIIDFASENGADCIVMEHLDFSGRIKGSKKYRLSLWRKKDILHRVEQKAPRHNMRFSTVCPWNTSRLAYDGSGRVERDEKKHSLCTFTNQKQYNCDLSASYNIGARYFICSFINGFTKSCDESQRLDLQAKVPDAFTRTQSTLSTLIRLNAAAGGLRLNLSSDCISGETVFPA